ncbi:hypothetical protein NAEX_07781 [Nannocystis exedens]|nr:hypothetical protein NAEX_07781 [Nannocystis exedens]
MGAPRRKTKTADFRFKRPDGGRHPATQATFNFLRFATLVAVAGCR